jgi:hypothetical protein
MHIWSNLVQRRAHGISLPLHSPYSNCFATPGWTPCPRVLSAKYHFMYFHNLCAAHLFVCFLLPLQHITCLIKWFFPLCLQGGPRVAPTCLISSPRARRLTWAAGCSRSSTATSRCPPHLTPCSTTTLPSTGECHFTPQMHHGIMSVQH